MTKDEFIQQCLQDAIACLSADYQGAPTTDGVRVGLDFIYPQIALERLHSIRIADRLFKDKAP